MLSVAAIATAVGGRVGGSVGGSVGERAGGPGGAVEDPGMVECARVGTDTRAIVAGDLFVALRGERFDGHDFLAQAFARGAVAALVADDRAADCPGPFVAVPDTLVGLGQLAAYWRRRFELPVVVIVGSNGKTTVKEMIAAILRAHYGTDAVLATRGNLNNAVGLPLTLLELRAGHRVAAIELGMNHPGETRELAAIVAPTIAVVNNAQREHQEFMRSTADVAREHAALVAALPADGTAVLNADDPHVDVWQEAARVRGCRTATFGLDRPADVGGEYVVEALGCGTLALRTPAGAASVRVAVPGRHNARNALAATAATLAAGVSLASVCGGLAAFRPVAGRLATVRGRDGAMVIDDSYNANPDSVRAAIDVLADWRGPKWLVLGDMGEVGDAGPAFHREVGRYAKDRGVDRLLAVGSAARAAAEAFGSGAEDYATVDAVRGELERALPPGLAVLVKGSRFMRMERAVGALAPPGSAGGAAPLGAGKEAAAAAARNGHRCGATCGGLH